MQPSFLQSAEWEEFQKSIGRNVWRIGGALVIRHDLPFGMNYFYCPRPVNYEFLRITDALKAIVSQEKPIFLKIDPVSEIQNSKFKIKNSQAIQPRKTAIINLSKSEEELLRAMHEKTRYNIRLAAKKGVEFKIYDSKSKNEFDKFWALLGATSKRDRFSTHKKYYYEKLLAIRSVAFSNELFFAEYRGEILAAALVNFYGDGATYLHGASSGSHREVMAPAFLHWGIIQEAKKKGFKYYDLWGIDEKKWPGVTRFKLGFGGEIIEYPSSFDIIYSPIWYQIYRAARQIF
jgi:lipid II:glycine glycyltransferase (peptidoglycan interpeptide bridge formation enzyme)